MQSQHPRQRGTIRIDEKTFFMTISKRSGSNLDYEIWIKKRDGNMKLFGRNSTFFISKIDYVDVFFASFRLSEDGDYLYFTSSTVGNFHYLEEGKCERKSS